MFCGRDLNERKRTIMNKSTFTPERPSDQAISDARKYAQSIGSLPKSSPNAKGVDKARMLSSRRFGRFFGGGIDAARTLQRHSGMLAGLGKPSDGGASLASALKEIMSCGFMQTPVIEYKRWTFALPLLDADIASTFGETVSLLTDGSNVPGIADVSSSFVGDGSTLQVDMFCAGAGIHGYSEPISFAIPGNAVATTQTAPIWSADVWTAADLATSSLGPFTATGTVIPALLEWGGVVQEMFWRMSQAYRVRWYYNQKFILLDEPLADFAYFTSYGDAQASGTSERAIQTFVKQVNANYRAMGSPYIFEPITGRRYGSITNTTPANTGIFHPTRDYDFADVMYGGLSFQQGGCCKPYHQLPTPVLLERGITIGLQMESVDDYNLAQMQRLMSISQGVGGTFALVQMDQIVNGFTASGAVAGRELTLDQGANTSAFQSVDTDRMEFEGGTAELFVGLRGQELWGDWRDQLKAAAKAGLIQAPSVTGSWHGGAIT
jgi:hypothetical protein